MNFGLWPKTRGSFERSENRSVAASTSLGNAPRLRSGKRCRFPARCSRRCLCERVAVPAWGVEFQFPRRNGEGDRRETVVEGPNRCAMPRGRKSVVAGKIVSVRLDLGGRRTIKQHTK